MAQSSSLSSWCIFTLLHLPCNSRLDPAPSHPENPAWRRGWPCTPGKQHPNEQRSLLGAEKGEKGLGGNSRRIPEVWEGGREGRWEEAETEIKSWRRKRKINEIQVE